MRVLSIVIAILIFAPVAAAQADHTVWLHKGESGIFMSADQADPANDGSRLYRNFLGSAANDYTDRFDLAAPAPADVMFRDGEQIKVVVHVGDYGGWFVTWGDMDIAIDLTIGGQTVSGAAQAADYAPGASSDWIALEWNLDAPVAQITAGDEISLVIKQSGTASGYVIGTNGADGHSHIIFPGVETALALAPATVYEDLDAPIVNHAFANATSDTYMLNFTTENGFGIVDLDINGTGFANATLLDGNGTEVFNGTLVSGMTEYQNFTAGDWNLTIDYTDFNGTLDFEFLDGATLQAASIGTPAGGPSANNGTTNETAQLDGVGDDNQEAPGLALPLVMAGLVAFVRRRR